MSNIETKIKKWLEDESQSSREIIAEYVDDHRPKCDDGSDDFIEGNYNTAQRLLLQIKEWEQSAITSWNSVTRSVDFSILPTIMAI